MVWSIWLKLELSSCFSMSLFASQCLYFSNSHWLLVAQKLLKYLAAHWLPLAQKLLKLVHWPLLKIDTLRTSQIETLRPSQNWHLLKIEILRNFSNWELRTTQNWTSQNWHVRAPLLRRFSKVAQTTTWPRTTSTLLSRPPRSSWPHKSSSSQPQVFELGFIHRS